MTLQISQILAVSFFAPAMVGAGAALIAIPVIIHILNRQRFRIVNWAAMEFLLRAMKRNRRRLRMEQWILLAVRSLAVFLIGLALARPMSGCSTASVAAGLGGGAGLHVFVIDNSFSTLYEGKYSPVAGVDGRGLPPAKNHLEQQKQMAHRLIETLDGGSDAVAIITAADPAIAVIAKPGNNIGEAIKAIDAIKPAYTRTNLSKALDQARQIAMEKDGREYASRHLYVFTDGTRSAWEGEDRAAIRQVGPELTKLYRVSHFDVSDGKPQWNRAVERVAPASNLVTTRMEFELQALARGYGALPSPQASVKWTIDGKAFSEPRTITPDPSTDFVGVRVMPKDLGFGGVHVVSAALSADGPADGLPTDDRRYRVIEAASEVRVLIVEGEQRKVGGKAAIDSPAFFLEAALAPRPQTLGTTPSATHVTTETVGLDALDSKRDLGQLDAYRAIFLCDVPSVSDDQAKSLARFVYNGGSLIMFMGDRVDPDKYNETLGNPRLFTDLPRATSLLPGRLLGLADRRFNTTGFRLDFNPQAKVVHPFLKEFRGYQATGLDTARVNAYMRVDLAANASGKDAGAKVARVLNYVPPAGEVAQPGDPDPAITVHGFGAGSVVLFTTAANPVSGQMGAAVDNSKGELRGPWHTLIGSPAWVQLMHETLAGSVTTGDAWMNLESGQPLRIPVRVDATTGAPVLRPTLADEEGNKYPLSELGDREKTATGVKFVSTEPLTKPGLYTLTLTENRVVKVAVNPSAQEADIRTVGNTTIREALTAGRNVTIELHGSELPLQAIMNAREGSDWAPTILMILLGLLAIECYMAMRFGHYKRVGQGEDSSPVIATPASPAQVS